MPSSKVKLGIGGEANFATGDEDRRFTTGETDFLILGLGTLDLTDLETFVPTRVHINAGYRWNKNEEEGYGIFLPEFPDSSGFGPPAYPPSPTGDDTFNDELLFNAALEFPAPQVTFFLEFDWHKFINVDSLPSNLSDNVLTLTPGVAIPMGRGFELKGAGDVNLNSGDTPSIAGPPDWGLWLMLSWNGAVVPQDTDRDGVPDKDDGCPEEAEDLDGYQDDDGCPDRDNDNDGIADLEDVCPDLAEDVDGFEDLDGCPDLDNDQDGIPDADDQCPMDPEDIDQFEDENGCPDEDRLAFLTHVDHGAYDDRGDRGLEGCDRITLACCPGRVKPVPPIGHLGPGQYQLR